MSWRLWPTRTRTSGTAWAVDPRVVASSTVVRGCRPSGQLEVGHTRHGHTERPSRRPYPRAHDDRLRRWWPAHASKRCGGGPIRDPASIRGPVAALDPPPQPICCPSTPAAPPQPLKPQLRGWPTRIGLVAWVSWWSALWWRWPSPGLEGRLGQPSPVRCPGRCGCSLRPGWGMHLHRCRFS